MSQLITDEDKSEMLRRGLGVSNTKVAYCWYDKCRTLHEVQGKAVQGNGPSLICLRCGSVRMDKIQGVDASLM